jgi:hypothetical protein
MSSEQGFRKEFSLLLACARANVGTSNGEEVRSLVAQGIHWPTLYGLAMGQFVLPMLYASLNAASRDLVPSDVMGELQNLYQTNLRSNLYLTNELLDLLKDFSAHQINAIPYKGPILASTIYKNLALRQSGDLDVIVHESDVHHARELILARGYQQYWPAMMLSESQAKAHLTDKYNYTFIHPDKGVTLELHWGITPRYFSLPPDAKWLWERLEAVSLGGLTIPTFTPEDYLLILCIHGANHCWMRLSWIIDIAVLLRQNPGLDWDYVFQQADHFACSRIILLGLQVCHALLAVSLPATVTRRLERDQSVALLVRQVLGQFASTSIGFVWPLQIPMFHVRSREHFSDRVKYIYYAAAPSVRDWEFIQLPKGLWILYYLLRPIRLLIEYGLIPLRSLAKVR